MEGWMLRMNRSIFVTNSLGIKIMVNEWDAKHYATRKYSVCRLPILREESLNRFFILRFSVVEQYMSKSVFRRQCKCTVTPGKTQANHFRGFTLVMQYASLNVFLFWSWRQLKCTAPQEKPSLVMFKGSSSWWSDIRVNILFPFKPKGSARGQSPQARPSPLTFHFQGFTFSFQRQGRFSLALEVGPGKIALRTRLLRAVQAHSHPRQNLV